MALSRTPPYQSWRRSTVLMPALLTLLQLPPLQQSLPGADAQTPPGPVAPAAPPVTAADFTALGESKRTEQQHRCEAHYGAGSKALVAKDSAAAIADFTACLATGITTFQEYSGAASDLRVLTGGK